MERIIFRGLDYTDKIKKGSVVTYTVKLPNDMATTSVGYISEIENVSVFSHFADYKIQFVNPSTGNRNDYLLSQITIHKTLLDMDVIHSLGDNRLKIGEPKNKYYYLLT